MHLFIIYNVTPEIIHLFIFHQFKINISSYNIANNMQLVTHYLHFRNRNQTISDHHYFDRTVLQSQVCADIRSVIKYVRHCSVKYSLLEIY